MIELHYQNVVGPFDLFFVNAAAAMRGDVDTHFVHHANGEWVRLSTYQSQCATGSYGDGPISFVCKLPRERLCHRRTADVAGAYAQQIVGVVHPWAPFARSTKVDISG